MSFFQFPWAISCQEFASLIVCAVAGLFAVSIHYIFFVVWLAGYMVYRPGAAW